VFTISEVGLPAIIRALDRAVAALEDFAPALEEASTLIYEHERQWFDSDGGGTWSPLAESTIAAKVAKGAPDPERILFEFGRLFESATSPAGPYSFQQVTPLTLTVGLDWEENGVQLPPLLSHGSPDGHLPARAIYNADAELIAQIGLVLQTHVRDAFMGFAAAGGAGVGSATKVLA
jgi:hypothetical protein